MNVRPTGKSVFISFQPLRVRRAVTWVALFAVASGCLGEHNPITHREPPLDSVDAIATVGRRSLSLHDLNAIAAKIRVDPHEFANRWVLDSVLAQSALAGILHASRVHEVERSVLARALLSVLYQEAQSRGAPTEQELHAIATERWYELDRPAAAQTTHFVVRPASAASEIAAEQIARRLAISVRGAKSPDEFRKVVSAYPKADLEVVVESLPPVTSDGRSLRLDQHGDVIGAGPSLDRTFARAANSLTEAGEQSGIVHSEFGFHVIMLERIISPHTASVEALRQKFSAEVYLRRARAVSDQLINAGRQRYAVRVESSFQEAAAQLQAAP